MRYAMGRNAGFKNYRDYRWVQLNRFDYGPEDALRFCESVEKVVVPIVSQLYQAQAERLGVEKLKAWDVGYDPRFGGHLRPFETIEELEDKAAVVFRRIDPTLGDYFGLLRREKLMDLETRPNKSPFSYSETLPFSRKPFVFATIGGTHLDMMSVFHEAGHGFHVLEGASLPHRVMLPGAEMCEVASTTMEFLASEHLDIFYTEAEAQQARVIQLEAILKELPEIAVGVAFQHWLYTQDGPPSIENCDAKWAELWARFMVGIDTKGMEDAAGNFWRHVARLYFFPFYTIEYALATIGAIQIWQRYLENPAQAVADYRVALGMGNTVGLPALYERAGAKFAFDEETLRKTVEFLMGKIKANGG
jgi:oligoendopeptidase F